MVKPDRTMSNAGEAQRQLEQDSKSKFDETENLAKNKVPFTADIPKSTTGRISPQLSCTIAPEDKEKLTDLTLRLSLKKRKALNTSTIIRALIRLGEKYEEELDV